MGRSASIAVLLLAPLALASCPSSRTGARDAAGPGEGAALRQRLARAFAGFRVEPFSGYRVPGLRLWRLVGAKPGRRPCAPSSVIGTTAGGKETVLGRDLLRRALRARPTPSTETLARLTIDALLKQAPGAPLTTAQLARRCRDEAKRPGCAAPQRALVADPRRDARRLVFWKDACAAARFVERVVLDLDTLQLKIDSSAALVARNAIARDPLGWVALQLKRADASGQRDALKRLAGCRLSGARALLQRTLARAKAHIVREKAAVVLGRCPAARGTVDALLAAAGGDAHASVRRGAIDALARLRARRALPALRRIARRPGPTNVRYAAHRAVRRIAGWTRTKGGADGQAK